MCRIEMDRELLLLIFFCANYGVHSESYNEELYSILLEEPLKCKFDTKDDYYNVDELKMYRFDFKANATDVYSLDDARDVLENDNFIMSERMELFIHGFNDDVNSPFTKLLRQSYEQKATIPIYIMDASAYIYIDEDTAASYYRAVDHSYHIGNKLAEFLYDLVLSGVPVGAIHLIGHSIGAHIAGYAARRFEEMSGEKLKRITGLDPAGPCFTDANLVEQIKADDAEFVDLYHCNRGELGTSNSLGSTDFFPNGDYLQQPECREIAHENSLIVKSSICSHYACVAIFSETVNNEFTFVSEKCSSFAEFEEALCIGNERTIAGFAASPRARGKFYFTTNLANNRKYNIHTEVVHVLESVLGV